MNEKILFWIDAGLVHFGIAKFLQEKYDCDLFAIYDLNHHLKESFQDQQLVKFQKVWYFWEHVSKTLEKKPDLKYLASFENKYSINLWLIAYSERLFSKYNLFHKFSDHEILSILEQECRFFENVLDEVKPDFLIIKVTDFHRNHLLAEICKSRGIQVLMLVATNLGYRTSISSDAHKIDDFSINENKTIADTITDLHKYLEKFDKLKQSKAVNSRLYGIPIHKKINRALLWMIKTFDKEYRNSYDHYGITRLRVIAKKTLLELKTKYRKSYIDRNSARNIDEDEKFVYFPMQLVQERNVDITAPFYINQIEVITNIAKSLPVDYKLYVKEHHNMKFRNWRSISNYKEILDLPNVKLIHPSVNPTEIIKKCSIVITITGSSGLEAAFYGKPSIVFADVIYSSLPSVYRLKSYEELPHAIRLSLQKKVNPSDLNEFVNMMNKNSFELNQVGLENDMYYRLHPSGLLISDNVDMIELNSFLEENRAVFEKLAMEHIKKIKQYKKYEQSKQQL